MTSPALAADTAQQTRHMDVWSGTGLVVSSMVGAGVFLSAGFMSQDLGPGTILAAWLIGALIALAGVRTYSQMTRWAPRSGGEYRYLADLVHPSLGYLAGWGSLLLGFAAPVAINALAAGTFAALFWPGIDPRIWGIVWIVMLTALHALGLRTSRLTQNALVAVDVSLLLGFVAVGLTFGTWHWPTWQPSNVHEAFPVAAFVQSLFFVAYAFAGWNTSVYVASEFQAPERDVPRSMRIGTLCVAALYLVVNWVFVANLTPDDGRAVFEYEARRVTLGHLVVTELIGPAGGVVMSLLVICAFTAAASAYTLAGPRVYAEMARDGFLPRWMRGRSGRPPVASVLAQGVLALVILNTHTLREALANVGAILTLFAALVALAIFKVWWRPEGRTPPDALTLAAAAAYVIAAGVMLYVGFRASVTLVVWLSGMAGVALVAYAVTPRPDATRQ
jgi:APA family basic amino acid/polyamine antiporter